MTIYKPQTTDSHCPLWALTGSHRAGALDVLAAGVNAHWPGRDHASDGYLGDARHVAEGSGSDHNPWLNHTVRAGDFDKDGMPADWFAEQLRALGAAGDHRLTGGGYVIWNGRYAGDDTGWKWVPYTGEDDHSGHVHVSLSRNVAGYEDRGPWTFLSTVAPQPPHPAPAPAPAPDSSDVQWTGHDATGTGEVFRADIGDEGPKVEHLQHELNVEFPAYSHLTEDGQYGHATAAVVEEFDHRAAHEAGESPADAKALTAADGLNVGPAGARALHRHGLI